jgi:Fur family transcriptional regulator, peroxide stress response regulator
MRRATHKRATRQLEAVFQALQGDSSHPFADEVYRRVRQELPRISLATVYRNLQRLVEDGKIRTVLLGERVARYDPETSDHDHFICQSCGRVIDLFLERARQIDLTPLANDGYIVTTHNLMIYGVCQVCTARRETAEPQPRPCEYLSVRSSQAVARHHRLG